MFLINRESGFHGGIAVRKKLWSLIVGALFILVGAVSLFQGDIDVFLGGLILGAIFILIWWVGNKRPSSLKSRFPQGCDTDSSPREEGFSVAGVQHYLTNIMSLRTENADYKKSASEIAQEGKCEKRLFQYYFTNRPVLLAHEPDNPHDSQAIRVDICGKKVGYIYHDDIESVNRLLYSDTLADISAFISGGKYRIVSNSGEVIEAENNIAIYLHFKC